MTSETLGHIAAFLTTFSFVPQAYITLKTQNTAGISLTMYIIFFLGVLSWLIYGIQIENSPIIFANSITIVLAALILFVKIKNTLKKT
ncbi:SemiSWEET transporter [Gangjinia marincola]|uniref:SemiSWEET transporter n=1 Tax=Gangjinia marincola TaxID=578463 RepID=A0ABP3XU24_9FLAO